MLYSDDLVDSIISKSDIGTVTVKDIAEHLGHLLSNAYCRIHAYLSIEAELVLLVLPVKASPSRREVSGLSFFILIHSQLSLEDKFMLIGYHD